jgi:lipopolysaccharide assembly protein A
MGGGIIAILALIFILQNREDLPVNFLWLDIKAPLWVWLAIMFLAGGAVGWIASRNRIRRKALEKQAASRST